MITQDDVTNWSAGQVERHNKQQTEYVNSVMRDKGHYGRLKKPLNEKTLPKNSDRFNARKADKTYNLRP